LITLLRIGRMFHYRSLSLSEVTWVYSVGSVEFDVSQSEMTTYVRLLSPKYLLIPTSIKSVKFLAQKTNNFFVFDIHLKVSLYYVDLLIKTSITDNKLLVDVKFKCYLEQMNVYLVFIVSTVIYKPKHYLGHLYFITKPLSVFTFSALIK
jgi:hypothetical protein